MSTLIKIKRSAVPGKVPTSENLEVGELAINTFDGKLYTKLDRNGDQFVRSLSDQAKVYKYEFVAAENQTIFTIPGGYNEGTPIVYVNGVLLFSDQYVDSNESTITITSTIETGDDVIVLIPRNIQNDVIETEFTTIQSKKVTIESNLEESISLFSSTHFRASKVLLQIEQGTDFYFSELNIAVANNGNTYYTEYGVISNNTGMVDLINTSINNNSVFLLLTLDTATTAKVTIHQTLIKKD